MGLYACLVPIWEWVLVLGWASKVLVHLICFRGSYSILETNVMINFAIGFVINRLDPYVSRF